MKKPKATKVPEHALLVRALFVYCIFRVILNEGDRIVVLNGRTTELLALLDAYSGHTLTRMQDLGILIEAASDHSREQTLDELIFLAKFIHKTRNLIQRQTVRVDGDDRLLREFRDAIKKALDLISSLLSGVPQEDRKEFESRYFAPSPALLEGLLALCHDLSWYKNWMIDHPRRDRP